jgi:putative membrane protein insertion efficiency factor
MKKSVILLIRFYQKFLSLDSGWPGRIYRRQPTCRFYPRCSDYTIQAVEKYGVRRGLVMGGRRIARCHPWNEGGIDELK